MFYNFLYPLADLFTPFNLFRYLTFRSIAAFLTALVLSFLIGGALIRWLRSKQKQGQPIRDDGPASHLMTKKGTPTMGGLLILITLSVATLLWADLTNRYVWIVLGVAVEHRSSSLQTSRLTVWAVSLLSTCRVSDRPPVASISRTTVPLTESRTRERLPLVSGTVKSSRAWLS